MLSRLRHIFRGWFRRGPRAVPGHARDAGSTVVEQSGPLPDPAGTDAPDLDAAPYPVDEQHTAPERSHDPAQVAQDTQLAETPGPSTPGPAAANPLSAADAARPWMPPELPRHTDTLPPAPVEPVPRVGPDRPIEPERPLVRLTDFSDVNYPVVAGGFPSPPGCGDEQHPRATRRWTRRASTLRGALLAETIEDLRVRSDAVADVAADEPVEVLWPTDAEPGTHGEFRVPELDPSYVITRGDNKGRPRTLDLALPSLGPLDERPADDFDRLELVRLVAILLEGLHRVEVVTAGLDWSTFIFTLDPRPGVVMHRPEALRRLGGEFLAAGAFSGSPATSLYDADRHAFALLASRLLVSHDAAGSLDPWNERGIPGLSRTQSVRMSKLWERSAGGAGTRPQVAEWREALGV